MSRKAFFSKLRAIEFSEVLRLNGVEFVKIWADKDGFGQNVYIVEWYL